MRKTALVLAAAVWLLLCQLAPAHAEGTGYFPTAHEVFKPLEADPRELHYSLEAVVPVSHDAVGEAALGDYLGMYRWALPWESSYFQISVGGGVFGRFDLAATKNDLQVVDFYGNLPFDVRVGKWSGRFMIYHTSSHLGDDYLQATGQTTTKHTWDNLRWLGSYDFNKYLRLYGGYTYVFRTNPTHLGRNALQGGFETYSPWWGDGHAQVYWANDFQSWERAGWNPMFSSQLGVKVMKDPQTGRGVSFYLDFGVGKQPQGQFFLRQETRWGLGIKFHLAN